MLVSYNSQFFPAPFENEAELEKVVTTNYQHLFGRNSLFLPKLMIRTADGKSTTPDGFAIDLEKSRWYLVEAELVRHGLWTHIEKQVMTQIMASRQMKTRNLILEASVEQYKRDASTRRKFRKLNVTEIDVHRHLENILLTDPIIGMPIDGMTEDLKQWATALKNPVKFWEISKFVQFPNRTKVIYHIDGLQP